MLLKLREVIMKTKVRILDNECDYLDDDIPNEIDFSGGIRNPFIITKYPHIILEPDIAKYFKDSNQVNNFLRNHINELELVSLS